KADAQATLKLDGSDAANALLSHSESQPETGTSVMDGVNTLPDHYAGGSSATFVFAAGEKTSMLSTSALVTETPNSNGEHPVFQLKPNQAVAYLDNFKFADDDSHPGKVSHKNDSHPSDDDDSHPGKEASDDDDNHPGKASHDNDSHSDNFKF